MGPTTGFDAYQPYINLVKGTIDNWSSPYVDANGEVSQLPPGRTMAMNLWYGLSGPYHKVKTGPHVVKWTGGAATLTITCDGATIGAQTGRRRTLSLVQVSDSTTNQFKLAFTNDTRAPIDIRQLVVCHADHEALLDSGEIFNPDYLEACGRRVAFVRTMKPMGIENSLVTSPAQLKSEASQSWCVNAEATIGGMPYAVAAKLAAKLNCNVHAPVPIRGSPELYDEIARQLASVAAFTGVVDAEVGNENWNDGYNARQWLNSVYGPSQTPVVIAPQAEAQKALMWFRALAKYFPRQRIRRLFCGHAGDGFWPSGYVDMAMRYVDTAGILQKGAPFYSLIDEIRFGIYTHVATSAAPDGSGELYHARLRSIDWATRTDAQIDEMFAKGQAAAEARLRPLYKYLKSLRPSLAASTYEWGQECTSQLGGYAGTSYTATISPQDNTLVWDASTPASFTDGDAWLFYDSEGPYPSTTYRRGDLVYPKAKNAGRAWFFATDAARRSDVANTGAGAIVLDAAAPGRLFHVDNHTRAQQFGARMKAYLDGPAGQAMYQRFMDATIGPDKLREACQLYDFAGYSQGYFVAMWGLKSSIYAADTPRYRWWRSL